MGRLLPDPVLSPLDARDRALLRPCLKSLRDLADSRRRPTSDGQRMFLAAVRGNARPVTPYEIAFLRWQRAGEPDLDALLAAPTPSAEAPPAASASLPSASKPKKKRRPGKSRTGMSVTAAKAPRKPRYSEAEIARAHRISGLGWVTAMFLPSGKVSPR